MKKVLFFALGFWAFTVSAQEEKPFEAPQADCRYCCGSNAI